MATIFGCIFNMQGCCSGIKHSWASQQLTIIYFLVTVLTHSTSKQHVSLLFDSSYVIPSFIIILRPAMCCSCFPPPPATHTHTLHHIHRMQCHMISVCNWKKFLIQPNTKSSGCKRQLQYSCIHSWQTCPVCTFLEMHLIYWFLLKSKIKIYIDYMIMYLFLTHA